MMRGRRYDYGILGRGITRTNRHAGGLLPALDLLAEVPGPRRAEVVAFAKRLRGKGAPLSGNRHFYRSDFMVHHRPGWYASARGFSTRTYNTDGAHNGEGIRSHHIADGANYLMRSGEEYVDIFPVWDWRKVPGTTVAQSTAPLDVKTLLQKGETSFVGGVSDGTYGMAAMDLQRDSITAKKAWFFFDDEYVCLGAGITDTSGFPVATTVDQRLLKGDVRAAGKSGPLSRSDRELRAGWVLHDGVGYLFPEGTPLHLSNDARTGHWSDIGTGPSAPVTKDVFTLWIDHGSSPTGASYQYTVVPGATPRSLEARLRSSPVDVLSNTPDLQAVRHARLGITMAAFHAPGTVSCEDGSSVTVDRPCLLLMRRTGNRVCLAVSNPENAALAVIVTLRRDKDSEPHTLLFDLPDGPVAGRSVIKEIDLGR
jgi:chondroitin AC lyase